MDELTRWWEDRSDHERIALGAAGGIAIIATGGALAYAVATGGVVIFSGKTFILIGAAAKHFKP